MNPAPVLVLGARSDIGRAIARRFAEAGFPIVLAARSANTLAADKADFEIRYRVAVSLAEFDVTGEPELFFATLTEMPGIIIMVAGLLGNQAGAETDLSTASLVIDTNYRGPVRFLLAAARLMESRGSCIIGISSVAGDRGRRSNFVYGSAKAGFTAFLSGLRARLFGAGIRVMTVKPGFVDTRMTAGMKLPRLLTAQPEEVGHKVYYAYKGRRDVIYVRPIWRVIMAMICLIPETIFKRLSL